MRIRLIVRIRGAEAVVHTIRMYICVYVYTYIRIYVYIFVYMHTCMYVYVYVCMHTCIHGYVYAHIITRANKIIIKR